MHATSQAAAVNECAAVCSAGMFRSEAISQAEGSGRHVGHLPACAKQIDCAIAPQSRKAS